jgi:hypothetical protein
LSFTLWSHGKAQAKKVKIGDDGLTGEAFSSLLEFIYTGETMITEENMFGLRSLASDVRLPRFVEVNRSTFFQEQITEQNCLSMMCSAQQWAAEGTFYSLLLVALRTLEAGPATVPSSKYQALRCSPGAPWLTFQDQLVDGEAKHEGPQGVPLLTTFLRKDCPWTFWGAHQELCPGVIGPLDPRCEIQEVFLRGCDEDSLMYGVEGVGEVALENDLVRVILMTSNDCPYGLDQGLRPPQDGDTYLVREEQVCGVLGHLGSCDLGGKPPDAAAYRDRPDPTLFFKERDETCPRKVALGPLGKERIIHSTFSTSMRDARLPAKGGAGMGHPRGGWRPMRVSNSLPPR